MMWGDILQTYPQIIKQLPKDVIVLNWSYDRKLTNGDCAPFAESGLEYYVCPGINGWSRFSPKLMKPALTCVWLKAKNTVPMVY